MTKRNAELWLGTVNVWQTVLGCGKIAVNLARVSFIQLPYSNVIASEGNICVAR